MKMRVRILAIAAVSATLLTSSLPASADGARSRFSDMNSYNGAPMLGITNAMIAAGGGAKRFDAMNLVKVLAGDKTSAEVAKLQTQYGKDDVSSFLEVYDFLVADAFKIAGAKHVSLAAAPDPSPSDGRALAAALYQTGLTRGSFDVEYMLDGLVSHPIHLQIMDDIDAKYGRSADANYHKVLQTAMTDLKGVYGL